jgi:hypothetical protein
VQSVFYGTTRKISRVGASFDFDEWLMARPPIGVRVFACYFPCVVWSHSGLFVLTWTTQSTRRTWASVFTVRFEQALRQAF